MESSNPLAVSIEDNIFIKIQKAAVSSSKDWLNNPLKI